MTITQALLLYAEHNTRFTGECLAYVRHIELGQRQLFTRKAAQFLTRRLEEDDAFPEGARARIQEAIDRWENESPEDAKQIVHLPHAPRRGPRARGAQSPIASARMSAGMTQAQLAEAIGVKPQQVGNWERGERNPKLDALERIAGACGCTVQDLIRK
ncbi:MAG: helix-turn-helix transcriptional regulator [Candidatus Ventricola sp.]